MATPSASSLDSSRESEPVMECRLVLTTLSGAVVKMTTSVAKHDRLEDTWQTGTTSIREDHLIASSLRFVHWCHASPNVDARNNPRNDPTVRVYQHLEDKLEAEGR